jgi:hypothetical protein
MKYVGLDPAVVTDTLLGGDIFVLCAVNSVMAVIFSWYVLIKPVVRRHRTVRK